MTPLEFTLYYLAGCGAIILAACVIRERYRRRHCADCDSDGYALHIMPGFGYVWVQCDHRHHPPTDYRTLPTTPGPVLCARNCGRPAVFHSNLCAVCQLTPVEGRP